MTSAIAKNAWLNAKLAYYEENNVFYAPDVDTYAEMWAKLFNVRAYLSVKDGGQVPASPENISDEVKKMIDVSKNSQKEWYETKFSEDPKEFKGVDVNNENDLFSKEFELQKKKQEAFFDELSMIANFITNCSIDVKQAYKDHQKEFLIFIDERQDYFTAFGLSLKPPGRSAGISSSWSGSP